MLWADAIPVFTSTMQSSPQEASPQWTVIFLAVLMCRTCWFGAVAVELSLFGLSLPVCSSCAFCSLPFSALLYDQIWHSGNRAPSFLDLRRSPKTFRSVRGE